MSETNGPLLNLILSWPIWGQVIFWIIFGLAVVVAIVVGLMILGIRKEIYWDKPRFKIGWRS